MPMWAQSDCQSCAGIPGCQCDNVAQPVLFGSLVVIGALLLLIGIGYWLQERGSQDKVLMVLVYIAFVALPLQSAGALAATAPKLHGTTLLSLVFLSAASVAPLMLSGQFINNP